MKISADYRMLARDALRGKWKTAVLTGIAASALGATIVSSSNSVVSNSNQAPVRPARRRSAACCFACRHWSVGNPPIDRGRCSSTGICSF